MDSIDTTKAEIIPAANITSSAPVRAKPNFTSFNKLAPNMTGIAIKKLNSAPMYLEQPKINAPKIVAPEREVPGIREAPETSQSKMLF